MGTVLAIIAALIGVAIIACILAFSFFVSVLDAEAEKDMWDL